MCAKTFSMEEWPVWRRINRKVWLALLFVLGATIMIFPLGLPIPYDPVTHDYYKTIEDLPYGSVVFWGQYTDYIAGYMGARDVWRARIHQLAGRGAKLILLCYGPVSTAVFDDLVTYSMLEEKYGYKYGEDYVIFPYLAGEEAAYAAAIDLWTAYTVDARGEPITKLPLLQSVRGLNDAKLGIIDYGGGPVTVPHGLVKQWGVRYGIPLIGAGYMEMGVYYGKYVFGCVENGALYELYTGSPGSELIKSDMANMGVFVSLVLIIGGLIHSVYTARIGVERKVPPER